MYATPNIPVRTQLNKPVLPAPPSKPAVFHEMPEFRLESMHAIESLIMRTRMSADDLMEILMAGRGIWMNNPANHWQNRAYVLIYSVEDAAFFIVIIACDPGKKTGAIVTVLTREQFENDKGEIDRRFLVRALCSSKASKETINEFRFNLSPSRRVLKSQAKWEEKLAERAQRVTVMVDYTTLTGVFDRIQLINPPGHDAEDVKEDLSKLANQPDFAAWVAVEAAKKGVPVERVLGLKARRGDGDAIALAME
jgi:hypothetical protein